MRVATLNVWGRAGDWGARRKVLRDGFRDLRPDLVTLQETIKTSDYDQVHDILGPEFHIAHQARRDADGMGVSIATHWPHARVRELDLRLTPRAAADPFPCTALLVEVLAPEPFGALLLVNHFPNWELDFAFEREEQAVAATRALDELRAGRDMHVIVAGDLDADPQAASMRFWTGRDSLSGLSVCYRDAWESVHPDEPGHTYTPHNPLAARTRDWPFRRIDYILVRCGVHMGPTLDIRDCQRIFDAPVGGVWASDHFGVVADLAMPRHSPRVAS